MYGLTTASHDLVGLAATRVDGRPQSAEVGHRPKWKGLFRLSFVTRLATTAQFPPLLMPPEPPPPPPPTPPALPAPHEQLRPRASLAELVALIGVGAGIIAIVLTVFAWLRDDIQTLSVTVTEFRDHTKDFEYNTQTQLDTLARRVETVESLKDQFDGVQTQLNTLTRKVGSIDELNLGFDSISEELGGVRVQVRGLSEKVGSIDELNLGFDSISEELGGVRVQVRGLSEKVGSIDELSDRIEEVTHDLGTVNSGLDALSNKLGANDEFSKRFDAVTRGLASVNAQLNSLTETVGTVDKITQELDSVRNALGDVKASLANVQSDLHPMTGPDKESNTTLKANASPPGLATKIYRFSSNPDGITADAHSPPISLDSFFPDHKGFGSEFASPSPSVIAPGITLSP